MKQILTTVVIQILLLCDVSGQLTFHENGQAVFTGSRFFLNKGDSISIDSTALKAWRGKVIEEFKKELKHSLETTLTILGDDEQPMPLAKKLVNSDTLNVIRADLQKIIDSIESGDLTNAVDSISPLRDFAKQLGKILNEPLYTIKSSIGKQQEYTLTRDDIASRFLTEYFSQTLMQNPGITRSTISDFYIFYTELKSMSDTVNSRLRRIYSAPTPENIENLYLAHLSFRQYLTSNKYPKLLSGPFFYQWLWSTGGSLKLNPLDVAGAPLIDTVPELDLLSKTFSKKEFVARNKRLVDENSKYMQKLLVPSAVINSVSFPVADPGRNQHFLLNTKVKDLEITDVRPLDRGEKIYLMVLNVEKGYKARYRITETKKISGQSPTEEIIDSATRTALSLYQLVQPQVAAITSISKALNQGFGDKAVYENTKFNNKTDLKFFDEVFIVPDNATILRNETAFWNEMERYLKELSKSALRGDNSDYSFYEWEPITKLEFKPDYFKLLRRKYKSDAQDLFIPTTQNKAKIDTLKAKIAGDYLSRMYGGQIAPIVIDSLRYDSLYIAQLINVMNFSSVPIARIETSTDTVPKYRSELVIIDDKADNVDQTVLIDRVNSEKKDSATIVSFNYKKGRSRLVEISFGLAYTFEPVWVQEESNNKVSSEDERFRGIAAIHFYPFKTKTRRHLYKIDEPFFGGWNRINFMLGVGIPKPLDNYYLGVGYDFGPGLKLNTGVHFHKYRQYSISNDEIIGDEPIFQTLVPYTSLSINPELVIKNIIGLFK